MTVPARKSCKVRRRRLNKATSRINEQVIPTVISLAKAADGSRQMTVSLHPAELGMVQVTIARTMSGTTQIVITADNPTTLLALQRDQPQLHRALDEAGIPAEGRTVTFHAAAAQISTGGNGSAAPGSHGGNQQGFARAHADMTDANGSAGRGRGSYAERQRSGNGTGRRPSASSTAGTNAAPAARTYRVGLDITA